MRQYANIKLRLDGNAVRGWHIRLCERIALGPGFTATIDDRPGPVGLSLETETLLMLEERRHRSLRPGLSTHAAAVDIARFRPERPADLIIDLGGDVIETSQPAVWRLEFDSLLGEAGLMAAIHAGRSPIATLRHAGEVIAIARLGTERAGLALASFEDYLARTITFIVATLKGGGATTLPVEDAPSFATEGHFRTAAKAAVLKIARRLYTALYHVPHWRVGWRKFDGPNLIDLGHHPAEGWMDLPDDRDRFYADPFPIAHEGGVTLFVEEFEHARGKGIISAAAFGPDGVLGPLEPVLDLPYHLSYPFVFEADGAFWMIPESCTAGTIDLFRATDFPRGWTRYATLVDNIVASDATLVFHDGRWWMFATVQDEGGSYSDALYLWSASDFRGPWTPHAHNPVLIDIASARPAGRIVQRDGMLIRPVQDCRNGYGNALGLAHILTLNDTRFEQKVEKVLGAGPLWPGRRLHTVNEAGGYEFIDGSRLARRRLFKKGRRHKIADDGIAMAVARQETGVR